MWFSSVVGEKFTNVWNVEHPGVGRGSNKHFWDTNTGNYDRVRVYKGTRKEISRMKLNQQLAEDEGEKGKSFAAIPSRESCVRHSQTCRLLALPDS